MKKQKTLLSLSLVAMLSSCATTSTKPSYASKKSVLDLVRSSYLKGCVDSKNRFSSLKGKNFNQCMNMAKDHESEVSEILE